MRRFSAFGKVRDAMAENSKIIKAFTPAQAAGIAGMSRPAFLKHVEAKRIEPDVFIGERGGFSLALLVGFRNARLRDGAKKRGPKPTPKKKSRRRS